MKFVLATILFAAVIAIIILLLFCCFRRYTSRCDAQRRPHGLQFDDDLARKHLLEEGEDSSPDRRSPSEQQQQHQPRSVAQSRYFVLGGHRFEATASGYRQIDDEASSYDPNEAQKLALNSDDTLTHVAVKHDDMVRPDDNPKPRKTRHPLAVQFSAMAHAAEATDSVVPEPNATRQFLHETKPIDNYVWPSRGGPAIPIHVEWSGNAPTPAASEEPSLTSTEKKVVVATEDKVAVATEETEVDVTISEADDIAPKEVGENPELLVKTDHQIVPKPKSKKGKKRQHQQHSEDQIET